MKYSDCVGSSSKSISADGIAPIKGPKNGITFVTPTITAIIGANEILNISRTIYVRTPIITLSIILPTIYPMKVSLKMLTNS